MHDLQKDLYDICQSQAIMGIDFGATIDLSDGDKLHDAIRDGLNIKGWREPLTVDVTLQDVWRYYEGDKLIEDETGCAIVRVQHALMKADTILNWFHVNGSIPVDTDGDGN